MKENHAVKTMSLYIRHVKKMLDFNLEKKTKQKTNPPSNKVSNE